MYLSHCPTCGKFERLETHTCPPAWVAIIAPLEMYRLGYGLPPSPGDVKALTQTVYADTPESAAIKYVDDYDHEQRREFAKSDAELWIEVRPANEPDGEAKLCLVHCEMVPEYTDYLPQDVDFQRYNKAMNRITEKMVA